MSSDDDAGSAMPIRAVVAAHGTFAAGIVSAVQQITGRGAMFHTLSNCSMSLDDIQQSLADTLDATGARVIFTDLPAGSCTMAVRRLMRTRLDLTLVTGVNLSLLLDFAMQDDSDPVEAARAALDRGRASMAAHGT